MIYISYQLRQQILHYISKFIHIYMCPDQLKFPFVVNISMY